MMHVVTIVLTLFVCASTAFAGGWELTLSSHSHGPERLIAVDKSSQTLIMLERKSPLHEVLRYPCTTGQSTGDKLVEGDLRTPEGVYFVQNRIDRKLDWDLYGDLAYSLNYPNPIDRINNKTGGGIWIHGRGKTFTPRDTRGCVALRVPDMKNVANEIHAGTPVVIANDLTWTQEPGESDMVALTLAKNLQSWATDWQNRDEVFFSHYNADLMAKSEGRSFDGFIANKRNIFAAKPWIHVMVDNLRIIPGPNYWVTEFDQFYRTPGRVSTTGKRFYWMQNEQDQWHIVGREYVPATQDMGPAYLAAKSKEIRGIVEQWRSAWLDANVDAYATFYAPRATQGERKGATRIVDYKKTLWAKKPPVKVEVDDLKVTPHPKGLQVAFVQVFEDANGYSDVGRKTMVLTPDNETWKIDSEQWRRGK